MTNFNSIDAQIRALLPEGWSFGYIGNVYGTHGCPSWRDDRSWYLFGPSYLPRDDRNVGGLSTDQAHLLLAAAKSIAAAGPSETPEMIIRAARAALFVARKNALINAR